MVEKITAPGWLGMPEKEIRSYLETATDEHLEREFFMLGAPKHQKDWQKLPGYVNFKIHVWNAVMRWISDSLDKQGYPPL